MAKYSTKATNFIMGGGSFKRMFTGGEVRYYAGAGPTSADLAPTGILLARITQNGSARTAEVLSRGSVTLSTGSSGSVNQIAVTPTGGAAINLLAAAVSYVSSLSATATAIVDAINANETMPNFTATVSGAKIIIEAEPGTGTTPNGWTVVSSLTTITTADVNMGTEQAGVAAVNGLLFGSVTGGVISPSGTWQGLGLVNPSGIVGYVRFVGSIADDDSDDTSNKKFCRMDCTAATSGADVNLLSTTIAYNVPATMNTGTITFPSS